MEESAKEYFIRMNNWEEHFSTIDDFIENLNEPSNASGALGRIAAATIVRLQNEIKALKDT